MQKQSDFPHDEIKQNGTTIGTGGACVQNIVQMAPPGPPRNPAGTPQSSTTAKVTFDVPADDGGSPIIGYKYSMDNGATWSTVNATVRPDGKLEFDLSSLSAGSTYTVKLLATNAIGRSTVSYTSVAMPSTFTAAVAATTTTTVPVTTTTAALAAANVDVVPAAVVKPVKSIPLSGLRNTNVIVLFALVMVGVGAAVVVLGRRKNPRIPG